ncbi:MAG: transketolase family protein [bacterium]|nr:transketolase family protein [bacterium]
MNKATRESFGEILAELGAQNENIVAMDADLSKSTKSEKFAEKFPDRFFEMGIQEMNMIGTSAGLSFIGKIPFICSFAVFLTSRYDQIRMSIAFPKANVRLIGTHSGLAVGEDGNSQMGLEDISLMRSLPNMVIIQPADDIETKEAIKYAIRHEGPIYFRLTRQKVPSINPANYEFKPGKGVLLRPGTDATLFVTGALVAPALQAAQELEKEKVSLRIVNIHTIKPIDRDLIVQCARETGKIITAEDHSIIGGLGSAVAEVLSEEHPALLLRIGVKDVFGESGTPEALYHKYGFDPEGIKRQILEFIKKDFVRK